MYMCTVLALQVTVYMCTVLALQVTVYPYITVYEMSEGVVMR